MAITKNTTLEKIEVVGEYKLVQVKQKVTVIEDGNLISETAHRYVLEPDMNIDNQSQEVKDICNVAWTQEIKDAWAALKTEQAAKFKNFIV